MKTLPELELELQDLEQAEKILGDRGFVTSSVFGDAIAEIRNELELARKRHRLRGDLFNKILAIIGIGVLPDEHIEQLIEATLSRVAEE